MVVWSGSRMWCPLRNARLRARYQEAIRTGAPAARRVAAELLRQIAQAAAPASSAASGTSDCLSVWGHVDGADLLNRLGASDVDCRADRLQSGHDWAHGSRTGGCLVFWPGEGRWWCASCRRGGDTVVLVRDAIGLDYATATDWLVEQYGPPPGGLRRRPARQRYNPAMHVVALTGVVNE